MRAHSTQYPPVHVCPCGAKDFYCKHGFRPILLQEPRLLISTAQLAKYNAEIVKAFKVQPQMFEIEFGTQNFLA